MLIKHLFALRHQFSKRKRTFFSVQALTIKTLNKCSNYTKRRKIYVSSPGLTGAILVRKPNCSSIKVHQHVVQILMTRISTEIFPDCIFPD